MSKKKVLIFPNTNTLSHFTRALIIGEWLDASGYEAHIAFSPTRWFWASKYFPRCHKIRELWEVSEIPFPCLPWFSNQEHLRDCVESQQKVIQKVKPDLIIGIFDFVSYFTCGSIPRLCINGACMLPFSKDVLGFGDMPSLEKEEQQKVLAYFWRYAADACNRSLEKQTKKLVHMANEMLVGDRTCLYELKDLVHCEHLPSSISFMGPLLWDGWEEIGEFCPWEQDPSQITIYINVGTLMKNSHLLENIMEVCLHVGARIAVSSGMHGPIKTGAQVFCRPFLTPGHTTTIADITVCTGGSGACYSNILYGTPSLVIPLQPEQATNGFALNRVGCGEVLDNSVVFIGNCHQYENAFDSNQFQSSLQKMIKGLRAGAYKEVATIQERVKSCNPKSHFFNALLELV